MDTPSTTIRRYLLQQRSTDTAIPCKDSRGQHNQETEKTRIVHQDIQSLATTETHYTKSKETGRRYLPFQTTIKSLYKAYLKRQISENPGKPTVSYSQYLKIFNAYNIGIAPPLTDTCNNCNLLKNKIDELREKEPNNLEALNINKRDLNLHKFRAKRVVRLYNTFLPPERRSKFYNEKLKLKYDYKPNRLVICMDLAQARPIPQITESLAYYKRKLMLYIFGIYDVINDVSYMFTWTEVEAKRGSNEIASCLSVFIDKFVSPHIDNLVIFSDNCAGQNKNINIVLSCLRFIHSNRFKKIDHVFMMSGHSYMPCDRDFGFISRSIKGETIPSYRKYIQLIQDAKPGKPFRVVKMKQNMFKNFDKLQKLIVNRKPADHDINFSDGKIFTFSSDYKLGYHIKTHYSNLLPPVPVILQREGVARKGSKKPTLYLDSFNLFVDLDPLYDAPVKLSSAKLDDIKCLLEHVKYNEKEFLQGVVNSQDRAVDFQIEGYEDYNDRMIDFN